MDLVRAGLGDVPVLAKEAAHVAARRAHAENACARQKMIQRFLLDGIDLQSGGRTIPQVIKFSVLVFSDESKFPLVRIKCVWSRALRTSVTPVFIPLPPPPLVALSR